jgi:hypothetical protein
MLILHVTKIEQVSRDETWDIIVKEGPLPVLDRPAARGTPEVVQNHLFKFDRRPPPFVHLIDERPGVEVCIQVALLIVRALCLANCIGQYVVIGLEGYHTSQISSVDLVQDIPPHQFDRSFDRGRGMKYFSQISLLDGEHRIDTGV